MKPVLPIILVPLSLTPSEASILLHAIDDALEEETGDFVRERLNSLRYKVNLALYGEIKL